MLITGSGMLVCEHGHGKLVHLEQVDLAPLFPDGGGPMLSPFRGISLAQLKAAWPERVIEPNDSMKKMMAAGAA